MAKLPKSGLLSSTGTGSSGRAVGTFGPIDISGGDVSPVSGSVSRGSKTQWKMRLFNNTEETVPVVVEVIQLGDRGARIKGSVFSYSLSPKQSVERNVASSPSAMDAQLLLRSWTPPKKKEKAGDGKPVIQAVGTPPVSGNIVGGGSPISR